MGAARDELLSRLYEQGPVRDLCADGGAPSRSARGARAQRCTVDVEAARRLLGALGVREPRPVPPRPPPRADAGPPAGSARRPLTARSAPRTAAGGGAPPAAPAAARPQTARGASAPTAEQLGPPRAERRPSAASAAASAAEQRGPGGAERRPSAASSSSARLGPRGPAEGRAPGLCGAHARLPRLGGRGGAGAQEAAAAGAGAGTAREAFASFLALLPAPPPESAHLLEHVYVRRVPGAGPYDFEALASQAEAATFTRVSGNCFAHYVDGAPFEVSTLERWFEEREQYLALCRLPFYRSFPKRKAFWSWRDAGRRLRARKAREALQAQLLPLQPGLWAPLVAARGMCLELAALPSTQARTRGAVGLEEFQEEQREWSARAAARAGRISARLRAELPRAFGLILQRGLGEAAASAAAASAPRPSWRQRRRSVLDEAPGAACTGTPELHAACLDGQGYQRKQQVRRQCASFVRLARLVDELLQDALRDFARCLLAGLCRRLEGGAPPGGGSADAAAPRARCPSGGRAAAPCPGVGGAAGAAAPRAAPLASGAPAGAPAFRVQAYLGPGEVEVSLRPSRRELEDAVVDAAREGLRVAGAVELLEGCSGLAPFAALLGPLGGAPGGPARPAPCGGLAAALEASDGGDGPELGEPERRTMQRDVELAQMRRVFERLRAAGAQGRRPCGGPEELGRRPEWASGVGQLRSLVGAQFDEARGELRRFRPFLERGRAIAATSAEEQVVVTLEGDGPAGLDRVLRDLRSELSELRAMPEVIELAALEVDVAGPRAALAAALAEREAQLGAALLAAVAGRLGGLRSWVAGVREELSGQLDTLDAFGAHLCVLSELNFAVLEQQAGLRETFRLCEVVSLHGFQTEGTLQREAAVASREFEVLKAFISEKYTGSEQLQRSFARELSEGRAAMEERCAELRGEACDERMLRPPPIAQEPQEVVVRRMLRVTIVSARGFHAADGQRKSRSMSQSREVLDLYCACEIEGKPETLFHTEVARETIYPVWGHQGEWIPYEPGDVLRIRVLSKDDGEDHEFGSADLASFEFEDAGFEGERELCGPEGRTEAFLDLAVHVDETPMEVHDRDTSPAEARPIAGPEDLADGLAAVERLWSRCQDLRAAWVELNERAGRIGLHSTPSPALDELEAAVSSRRALWEVALQCEAHFARWTGLPLHEIDVSAAQRLTGDLRQQAWRAQTALPPNPVQQHVMGRLRTLEANLPIVGVLCNPHMEQHHWSSVAELLRLDPDLDRAALSLGDVVLLGLARHGRDVEALSADALKNRRLTVGESAGFDCTPAFRSKLWKLRADSDPGQSANWFERDMWIPQDGSLVYLSVKEERELIYYTPGDLASASIVELDGTDSCKPWGFRVVLPAKDGVEFAPSTFAAESRDLRAQWVERLRRS